MRWKRRVRKAPQHSFWSDTVLHGRLAFAADDATLQSLATVMRTHYDNLKVLETATRDDIKSSYRKLCLKHHPDRNPGNAEAERIMRIINDAYDILSDPAKRRAYDQELLLQRARGSQSRNPSSSASSRREVWQAYQQTRPQYQRKPDSVYRGPPVRPQGGWYRKWASEQERSGSGNADSLGMRVLICVGIVAFANLFYKSPTSLPFGTTKTTTTPSRNFFESRPAHKKPSPRISASSPSSSLSPNAPDAKQGPASTKPGTAPNGSPWPETAGYIQGYPLASVAGASRVTLDNTTNDDDVFAKLTWLKSGAQVRTFYVPAHANFTLMSLNPGEYDLRFRNLATGRIYKTRAFSMKEWGNGLGVEYTTLSLRINRTGGDSLDTTEISEQDF